MPLPTFRRLLPLVGLAILMQLVAPAAASPADTFTVVLIPDTQNYSEKFPDTYLAQTRWIRNLAARTNVKFAIPLPAVRAPPECDLAAFPVNAHSANAADETRDVNDTPPP